MTIKSEQLLLILKNFHIATGTKVAIFSSDFNEIIAYPEVQSALCRHLKACNEGAERCRACDRTAQIAIKESGSENLIYTCHAGLREAIAPIKEGTTLVGYMMIGQCVNGNTPIDEAWSETKRRCAPYTDLSGLEQEFYALPRITDEQLEAFVNIMNACASYISLKEYVTLRHGADFIRVKEYIHANLTEDLSAAGLCAALYLSRNTLFKLIREETGLTLGQYVTKRRLEYGKNLLKTTDHTILQIAELCGINDFNYFSRLFKKEYGKSPRAYRRKRV